MIKVTSRIVISELKRRGIPVEVVAERPFVLLRYFFGGTWHLLRSTMPEATSAVGRVICDEKILSAAVAVKAGLPVPAAIMYATPDEAETFMREQGDIVVKPPDAAHGHGVTVGVADVPALRRAIDFARAVSSSKTVLLQQKISGSDLRMLVIAGTFVAAVRRIPASVIGDGTQTIRQLIEHENATNPERGKNDEKRLSLISLDASERFLGNKLDTVVPAAGEEITVVGTANIGAGGRAIDYTDKVPKEVIAAAETFARTVKVMACGVDFIWNEDSGEFFFIEGNACPGFCLHIEPAEGTSRPVDRHFVDALLGEKTPVWEVEQGASA